MDSIGNLKDLRHLNLADAFALESLPDSIGNLKNLRYLNLTYAYELKSLPDSIGNLNDLRRLNLESATTLESLPDSICDLKNLTHLNLERAVALKSLPDSIGNLEHLTHLNLRGTLLERLPESICDLVNLCYLDIWDTQLKSMPPNMGKLVKLQHLEYFCVGQDGGSGIAELGPLQNLHGHLIIENLQNVGEVQDALEAKIKDKSRLERLEYVWEDDDNDRATHDSSFEINLLQCLQPNVNIRQILIQGYRGTNFPIWVGDSSFSNIVILYLFNCKYCTCLPPHGRLPSLKFLHIRGGFDSIVSVGPEFYGDSKSIQPFKSLVRLSFDDFPKWQKWTCTENENEEDGYRAFPILEDLIIRDCPELEIEFTQGIFTSTLQRLEIRGCNKGISGPLFRDLHKFSSLSQFTLGSVGDIQSFPGMISLPSMLTGITISHLPNLKSLDYVGLQHLTSLESLTISNCPNLGCIPDEGLPQSLQHLSISGCPLLEKRCQREQGEDWPKISHIHAKGIRINNKRI